jgi:hypothetical protein
MFIGMFKARNREIERYNSSNKHLGKDWLEGCNDDPNNQMVDENYTENDTETETGNETYEVVGSGNETIDPETTY